MTDTKHLAELYGQEYMGKIFYYCLRKTGDSHEAEDLASDITLQVLTALHEGVDVVNFPAWVWQIARNRYALWAKTRRNRAEAESFIDPDDPETEGILTAGGQNTTPGVAEEYAHDEEMAILRRELAFLGRDYREVVVAFYIQDRSVGDIAASLGQPEGTVKSRLFRSRNLLKEGMKMKPYLSRVKCVSLQIVYKKLQTTKKPSSSTMLPTLREGQYYSDNISLGCFTLTGMFSSVIPKKLLQFVWLFR